MFIVLALLFLSLSNPTLAQSSTPASVETILTPQQLFEQYKTDYLYARDIYQKNYLDYVAKKQVHTKYGTIATQKEKIEAIKLAITSRNTMLKNYLTALRVYLDVYRDVNQTSTEKNQIEQSKWEQWFEEQNLIVPSLNNEDDIKSWSTEFKKKYSSIQISIYTAIIQQSTNKELKTLQKIQAFSSKIQSYPNITAEGQQWLQNITIKSDLVTTSLQNAINFIPQKSAYTAQSIDFYTKAKKETNKANSYLLEMFNNLQTTLVKFNK